MRLGITDEYYETGYLDFDRHLKIKRGQLNIVTGSPGSGKSEFVDDLMINMVQTYGVKWAVFSPENYPPQVYYKKLAEKYSAKGFDEMGENEINLSRSDLSGSVKLIIDNDTDEVTVDYLLERIRVLVFRFGVRAVIIDPWLLTRIKLSSFGNRLITLSELLLYLSIRKTIEIRHFRHFRRLFFRNLSL